MQLIRISAAAVMALFGAAGFADAGSAGRCGGTGGANTRTLTCPSGQYVAAMSARGGAFVDEFSIACRKLPVDGSVGSLGGFMSAGPGGGTTSESDQCDRKHAVRRLLVKSGAFVDKIEFGKCGAREGEDGGWFGDRSVIDLNIGGPGGGSCVVQCPRGEALYKITVKYGGWIDSIRGECRK